MTKLHAAAPNMLAALKGFADTFGEALDNDEEINGGDAVTWLGELWPFIKAAIAKAEGREG